MLGVWVCRSMGLVEWGLPDALPLILPSWILPPRHKHYTQSCYRYSYNAIIYVPFLNGRNKDIIYTCLIASTVKQCNTNLDISFASVWLVYIYFFIFMMLSQTFHNHS